MGKITVKEHNTIKTLIQYKDVVVGIDEFNLYSIKSKEKIISETADRNDKIVSTLLQRSNRFNAVSK